MWGRTRRRDDAPDRAVPPAALPPFRNEPPTDFTRPRPARRCARPSRRSGASSGDPIRSCWAIATIEVAEEFASLDPGDSRGGGGPVPTRGRRAGRPGRLVGPRGVRLVVADPAGRARGGAPPGRRDHAATPVRPGGLGGLRVRQALARGRRRRRRGDRLLRVLRPRDDRPGRAPAPRRARRDQRHRADRRGVAVVIPPWNFPLAIPTGMTVAALVTGNTVVLKPASSRPLMADAPGGDPPRGRPPPGRARRPARLRRGVGRALVEHPEVDLIAFTGSRDVGLEINRQGRRDPAGPGPRQARDRRDGGQERHHRRRRRRPRRGGRRRPPERLRLRRPEVLGLLAGRSSSTASTTPSWPAWPRPPAP